MKFISSQAFDIVNSTI